MQEGMGSMKITHGGLRLSGRTLVTNRLVASAIRSRPGRPLLIESTANVTLTARNSQGRLVNSLKLTKDGLECAQSSVFRVTDTRGETLFSADRSKVIVGAQELRVTVYIYSSLIVFLKKIFKEHEEVKIIRSIHIFEKASMSHKKLGPQKQLFVPLFLLVILNFFFIFPIPVIAAILSLSHSELILLLSLPTIMLLIRRFEVNLLKNCLTFIESSGGAVFQGSVQTPMVRADSRHDLRLRLNQNMNGKLKPRVEKTDTSTSWHTKLESASRRLELSGPQGVTIESRAGDITVSCLMDVKLQSIAGAVHRKFLNTFLLQKILVVDCYTLAYRLIFLENFNDLITAVLHNHVDFNNLIQIDAAKVFLKGLKTAKTTSSANTAAAAADGDDGGGGKSTGQQNSIVGSKKRGAEDKLPSVYQLCVCGNGKVFMSPPDGQCAADNESLVCR
ncbi:hypothetical protein QTP88_007252 [Uroleucon formosanum]